MKRSASSISASGSLMAKGVRARRREHLMAAARSSTSPVASLGFSVPADAPRCGRVTRSTYSLRTVEATAWASGDSCASMTTWVMP